MAAGRDLGVRPHGLQALFGLRLEKGHVIVGMDTELDSTPRRLDMDWAVKMDKPDFIGRTALLRTAVAARSTDACSASRWTGRRPIEGSPICVDDDDRRPRDVELHVARCSARAVMLGWLKHTPFPDRGRDRRPRPPSSPTRRSTTRRARRARA